MEKDQPNPQFEALLKYLQRTRGFDFSGYKPSSLLRRVERRMQQIALASFEDYMDYLEVHPEEFAQLFNTILINVTEFFRDLPAWEFLQSEVIPHILELKEADEPIRIWSAGCASGQEAYTLAIGFAEAMGADAFRERVKIYATDADEEALMQARIASYTEKEIQSVPEIYLPKYFEQSNGRYIFRNDLRRSVIFGRRDLVQDAPISRLDLLVCRNTLMYFNSETQLRILARLHFALNEYGYLFLGRAEMMMSRSNLFEPVNLKARVFSKTNHGNLRERLLEMAQVGDSDAGNQLARQIRIREAAIDAAPVAQLVVASNGSLMLVNERARTMFNLSIKDIGRPLQDLESSYRPIELRSLIEQAYAERRAVGLNDIQRNPPGGESQFYDLQIVPLSHNADTALGVIISFIDVTSSHRLQEELRRTAQDLETAYEELQSANEELETTNEELQSANEELETMNEELQSANEELHTVNSELRERTDEYNQLNSWLESVLRVQPFALIVIDRNLNVLLWNHRAEDMWGLRPDEVKGKSLFGLDIGLPVSELRAPILTSMDPQVQASTFTIDAMNRRGRSIKCRVNISPFGQGGTLNSGVVLLMEDITERQDQTQSHALNS